MDDSEGSQPTVSVSLRARQASSLVAAHRLPCRYTPAQMTHTVLALPACLPACPAGTGQAHAGLLVARTGRAASCGRAKHGTARGRAPAEGVAQQARDGVHRADQRVQAQVQAAAVRDPELPLRGRAGRRLTASQAAAVRTPAAHVLKTAR